MSEQKVEVIYEKAQVQPRLVIQKDSPNLWRFNWAFDDGYLDVPVSHWSDDMLNALALWWLGKHPALIGQVLSQEQREECGRRIDHLGRIAIPKEWRKELGIQDDDVLTMVKVAGQVILTPKEG